MMRKVRSTVQKLSRLKSTTSHHYCSGYGYITPSYEIERPVPVLYPLFKATPVDTVSIGSGFIVAAYRGPNGPGISAYGVNKTIQLGNCSNKTTFDYQSWGVDEAVVKLKSGRAHTMGLTISGGVVIWGSNNMGQLGQYSPVQAAPFANLAEKDIQDISVGLDNSFLVTKDGRVLSCGWSADGQTGCGTTETLYKFTEVPVPHPVCSISSSSDTTIVICKNGRIYGWGNNEYHQISASTEMQMLKPTEIVIPEPVISIAAGGSFSLFLSRSGNLYSCGYGAGNGMGDDVTVATPTLLTCSHDLKLKSIGASVDHAAGITCDGGVVMWGRGQHHKLISQHDTDIFQPSLLMKLSDYKINEVICGPIKTCIITDKPIKSVSCLGMIDELENE